MLYSAPSCHVCIYLYTYIRVYHNTILLCVYTCVCIHIYIYIYIYSMQRGAWAQLLSRARQRPCSSLRSCCLPGRGAHNII